MNSPEQHHSAQPSHLPTPEANPSPLLGAAIQTARPWRSFEDALLWYARSGEQYAQQAGLLIGAGEVGYKGIGLVMLHSMITNGILDGDKYAIPPFRVISPELVSSGHSTSFAQLQALACELGIVEARAQASTRITVANPALRQALESPEIAALGQRVIVRSLHELEGGPGFSFAGALLSLQTANQPHALMLKAREVIESAFSPLALWLSAKHGVEPLVPGLIVQKFVGNQFSPDPPLHIMFHTSVAGEVRGYVTGLSTPNPALSGVPRETVPFAQPLGAARELGYIFPAQAAAAVHELALLFGQNGRVPVEMELSFDRSSGMTFLLQHRFVDAVLPLARPAGLEALETTTQVTGSGLVKADWVVFYDCDRHGGAAFRSETLQFWLVVKELEQRGVDFVVASTELGIHEILRCSERGDNLAQMLLLKGRAVLELPPHFHESAPTAHFYRLVADRDSVLAGFRTNRWLLEDLLSSSAARLSPQTVQAGVETVVARAELWSEADKLFVPCEQRHVDRATRFPQAATVFAAKLPAPLLIYACESSRSGAVFREKELGR